MTEVSHAARAAVINEHLKTLKLPSVAREYVAAARRARDAGADYEEFLRELLEVEVRVRQEHSAARLLKRAGFPDVKTLDEIKWPALEGVSRPKIMELASCAYITRGEDVVLAGPIDPLTFCTSSRDIDKH